MTGSVFGVAIRKSLDFARRFKSEAGDAVCEQAVSIEATSTLDATQIRNMKSVFRQFISIPQKCVVAGLDRVEPTSQRDLDWLSQIVRFRNMGPWYHDSYSGTAMDLEQIGHQNQLRE